MHVSSFRVIIYENIKIINNIDLRNMYIKICQPTSLYTVKMNKEKKIKTIQKLINCVQMQSKEIANFDMLIYKTNLSILIKIILLDQFFLP